MKQQRGKYQFLFYQHEVSADNMKAIYISANNIEDACKKFMLKKPDDTVKVDYEVKFGKEFIDISDQEVINELI